MKDKTVNYGVLLPGRVDKVLDDLVVIKGIEKGEVIRQAIALFSYTVKEEQMGNTLAILKDDKVVREIVLLDY